MGDMLSQEEINALLNPGGTGDAEALPANLADILTDEQKDVLGEIGNISMGTAATTLFALLNQKVVIDTPSVQVYHWKDLSARYDRPCVGVRVNYKEGLQGTNILILKERDVKIITDLMMGGAGTYDDDKPLDEIAFSAISEAMNQMVGSASTSLSSMVKTKVDIDTPHAFPLKFDDDVFFEKIGFAPEEIVVCVTFKMQIGELIDSEIMQTLPKDFAVNMVTMLHKELASKGAGAAPPPQPMTETAAANTPPPAAAYATPPPAAPPSAAAYTPPPAGFVPPPVHVQPAQFQHFDQGAAVAQQKENMDIIMDVPLEVTVELGRTRKKIKDILEFTPGMIVELDKLAGEPIDILVNGKFVAKGEVVVIDENFGVRITDIINPEYRI